MNTRIRTRLLREGHILAAPPPPRAAEKSFFAWFREDVLGLDSEEYRREFWREACVTGRSLGRRPRAFSDRQRERGVHPGARLFDALVVCLVVGGASLAFWLVRRAILRHLARTRRPSYYDRERDRRVELGRVRRAITARRTHNPPPSLDAIREAWRAARRSPEAALRLGGMLEDLECHVDNRSRGDSRTGWRGRRGGIKRLFEREAPDLFEHYAAIMRYKAIARRFRQACGIADPVPADAVLPVADDAPTPTREVGGRLFPLRPYLKEFGPVQTAAELLDETRGTVISLEAAVALRIDPDCILLDDAPDGGSTSSASGRVVAWLRRRSSA